jgi:hypothetical protein
MPIWGITASAMSGHLSSFDSIATVTVGAGGSSTISFSSISSAYQHLQIRMIVRSAYVGNTSALKIRFNSDSGSNYYAYHEIYGDGASAAAYVGGSGTAIQVDQFPAANKSASIFGAAVIDILDYTSTVKNKVTRSLTGFDANGSGAMVFGSGMWMPSSIAAITQIDITDFNGSNFAQYSQLALYGVKA